MGEIPVISGVPVIPGTALATIVATVPPELVPLMPIQLLTALSALPATALVAAIPGATVVPAIKSDAHEKALISIIATAAAALSNATVVKA